MVQEDIRQRFRAVDIRVAVKVRWTSTLAQPMALVVRVDVLSGLLQNFLRSPFRVGPRDPGQQPNPPAGAAVRATDRPPRSGCRMDWVFFNGLLKAQANRWCRVLECVDMLTEPGTVFVQIHVVWLQ